jgi:hypothetical protein
MENIVKKLLNGSLAAIAATFVVSACAAESPKPAVRENLVQKTATVEAIDQASRVVKLRTEDGKTSTIVVDPEVRNLPQVKVGDKIVVSYYEALAAEVKKPGEGVKGVEADVSSVRSQPGEKPGGGAGVMMRTTVTIESVDTTFNTVSFKRQDGQSRTVAVESPEGREFIKGLKKGDEVEVAYTEALAIEVKPAN